MTIPAGYVPPAGPRWIARANVGDTQTDGRGVTWRLIAVNDGGRELVWHTGTFYDRSHRRAVTRAMPDHPDYPTDAAIVPTRRVGRKA